MGDVSWRFVAFALLMVLLTESAVVGLVSSDRLLLGWLPAQLGYDFGYTLLAPLLLYPLYRMVPEVTDVEDLDHGEDGSG